MIEVEVKYRLDDAEEVLTRLIARGAAVAGEATESDVYFAHPMRDFAKTDEALRVRWDGREASLTYKGPLLDAVSKSREECELELAGEAGLQAARQILERLGFESVRSVEKQRSKLTLNFDGRSVTAALDDVRGLGLFLELETLAPDDEWTGARDGLLELGRKLGLDETERRSYLQLLIEKDQAEPV